MRLVVAGGAVLPGMGAIPELLALVRDAEVAERFYLFDKRLSELEAALGNLPDAGEFAESAKGRQHATVVLAAALSTDSEDQRTAAAHAYLSGFGLGRFDPEMVELLDNTLRV